MTGRTRHKGKQLPDSFWNDVTDDYVKGAMSIDDIARKYDLSISTTKRRSGVMKWAQKRASLRATILRKRQHDTLKQEMKTGEKKINVRVRYAVAGRKLFRLTLMAMQDAIEEAHLLTPDAVIKLGSALRRAQEIEFAAYGIPSDTSKMEHEHTASVNFQEWLMKLRKSRDLPERQYPFLAPVQPISDSAG